MRHKLYLVDGQPILIAQDGKAHYQANKSDLFVTKYAEPLLIEPLPESQHFVGTVSIESNQMAPRGVFSLVAQTVYCSFNDEDGQLFMTRMMELFPEYVIENRLIFPDGGRIEAGKLVHTYTQFDGVYLWLCLFKAQTEGLVELTDGVVQLTHIDQVADPMKSAMRSLPELIERLDLSGFDFNGIKYSFTRPKLTI